MERPPELLAISGHSRFAQPVPRSAIYSVAAAARLERSPCPDHGSFGAGKRSPDVRTPPQEGSAVATTTARFATLVSYGIVVLAFLLGVGAAQAQDPIEVILDGGGMRSRS